MLSLTISLVLFSLSACQTTTSQTPAPTVRDIAWLQKAGNLTVNFNVMMNFNVATDDPNLNTLTWPTDLSVPAVPITWMGNIFNGVVNDTGPGYNLTDEVHGSMSDDGAWINEMTFSRKVLRQSSEGSYFLVTLVNLPIIKTETDIGTTLASFLKKGVDVRKFVSNVDYVSGGSIGTNYTSIDWEDTNGILRLEVDFASGPGKRPMGGPAIIGGGM
jgi:hypothetical protein